MTTRKTVQYAPTIGPELAIRRMRKLLEDIPSLRNVRGRNSADFETWEKNVKLAIASYYGQPSPVSTEFGHIWFTPGMYYPGQPEHEFINARENGLDQAAGFLKSRIEELEEELAAHPAPATQERPLSAVAGKEVFVVHGHDEAVKQTVARFLESIKLKPIILHEQANRGRTIIEKFEDHASTVGCAIALLTADDVGRSAKATQDNPRARQNVILELGFFVGKLGRDRTFALVAKGVELPSDIDGVIYINLEDGWQMKLARELKAAKIPFDAHALI